MDRSVRNNDIESLTDDPDLATPSDMGEKRAPEEASPDVPPDGGFTAWAHVLFMHIVFFNTWGVANGYGVFQEYYTKSLNRPQLDISWIGSVQMFLLFIVGVATGRLTDAGYFRPIFSVGVVLQVLGLFMTSLSKTYWQVLLAQAVCLGLGNGCTFCPTLAVLAQYFKKRRALAVGLASSGAAIGGLVYPTLVNRLIFHSDLGFPWTLRIMAFIMLATYLPCVFFCKPRLPPRRSGDLLDMSAFKDWSWVFFTLGMSLNFFGLYFAFFFLGTYARDVLGMKEPVYMVMVLNGVGIPGRIIPNMCADRYTGMLNLLVPLNIIACILVYCWAAVSSVAGLYVFAVIYGIIAAALQALFPAVATTMTPHPNRTGTRVGMILGFVSIANLVNPPAFGAVIDSADGNYVPAQMFAATILLLGALASIAARIAKTGWTWKVKI